ncbi:MAG: hypothetical protein E4H14_14810 [Candidatus Thorarchaeota archaeon]|nr:MAG: hypothetical protein E4H14_14810 [Candidatus Thorarchaeota archaeon]
MTYTEHIEFLRAASHDQEQQRKMLKLLESHFPPEHRVRYNLAYNSIAGAVRDWREACKIMNEIMNAKTLWSKHDNTNSQ